MFSEAEDAFFSVSSITIYMFYRLFLQESPEVQYNFRRRSHDKLLIPKTADLIERDFIIRLPFTVFLHCLSCVCQLFIKDHDDDDYI